MSEPSRRRPSYSTIDASEWLEQRNANRKPKQWWVAMLCNENNGEHTKTVKTTDPHRLRQSSPQREGNKSWALSNLVLAGEEEVADAVIALLNDNIRGALSKATWLDVISAHYRLEHYGSFDKIFKKKDADARLTRVPGPVVPSGAE